MNIKKSLVNSASIVSDSNNYELIIEAKKVVNQKQDLKLHVSNPNTKDTVFFILSNINDDKNWRKVYKCSFKFLEFNLLYSFIVYSWARVYEYFCHHCRRSHLAEVVGDQKYFRGQEWTKNCNEEFYSNLGNFGCSFDNFSEFGNGNVKV